MSQSFVKGRTNNHLTWVMVDATDFATPESALSAATTIKIYGKLRGATGVNFVSSGTGSLTNDIQHVGASATGIYTIALAKADLSDASAAWYDQYIIALSGTGAARQTLVVDGGIDVSALLALSDAVSNAYSAAAQGNSRILVVQSIVSDIESDLRSDLRSYLVEMSAVLSNVYSAVSDFQSDFGSRVPKEVASKSLLSDVHSDLRSYVVALSDQLSDAHSDLGSKIGNVSVTLTSAAISDIASAVIAGLPITSQISEIHVIVSSLNSEFLSRVPKEVAARSQLSDLSSDLRSYLVGLSGQISDIQSGLSNAHSDIISLINVVGPTISDIASAVALELSDQLSNILSAAQQTNSRVLVMSGVLSNVYSALSDFQSDFGSRVPKEVASKSLLSDVNSDLASKIGNISVTLTSAAISDIASAVVAGLPITSQISEIHATLSSLNSEFNSRVPKEVASKSLVSDVESNLRSHLAVTSGVVSDIYSLLSDLHSDVGVLSGVVSDVYSAVNATSSDVKSAVVANGVLTAGADITGVVGVTGTIAAKIDFLTALARNKITQTSALQKVFNDAGTSVISAAVADDGTTFTRDEWAG